MRFPSVLILAFSLLFSFNAQAADPKESLLVQKYLNAFASRDAAGIFSLINWDGVDRSSRLSLQKFIKSGFKGRQIRRIYIDPFSGPKPSYVQGGKTYQLNLNPSGQMNIVYISNKGKRSTTQLYVGEHKGQLMIGSAVEASTLACKPGPGTQTAC